MILVLQFYPIIPVIRRSAFYGISNYTRAAWILTGATFIQVWTSLLLKLKINTDSRSLHSMSATEETDFGNAPIIYPEGFIKAVAEDRNGHASSHESSGGSGSSSSNASQTQLVRLEPGNDKQGAVLDKKRHLSSSSSSNGSEGKSSEAEVVQEYYCGVGKCRPSWMQKLRDARFFTFLLCCNCFIEGALVSGELSQ